MQAKRGWMSNALWIAVASVAVAGCGGEPGEVTSEETGAAAEATEAVEGAAAEAGITANAAMMAVLEKADASDGTDDNVVANCVTCGLDMPGNADNKVTVGDYELHLCSSKCVAHFEGDPEAALTGLQIQ